MLTQKQASLLKGLSQKDKRIIIELYHKRCLSAQMMKHYVYKAKKQDFLERRIEFFESHELITPVPSKVGIAYFLTNDGIQIAKHMIERDSRYKTSHLSKQQHDLAMNPVLIPHQLYLNEFAYKLCQWARDHDIPHRYNDQIYAPTLSKAMMTDGILFTKEVIYFIETDTGTEKFKQLRKKWENYSRFIIKPNQEYQKKPIVVLFSLEGTKRVTQRKLAIYNSMSQFVRARVNQKLEILVGTPDELFNSLSRKYLPEIERIEESLNRKHGFDVAPAHFSALYPEKYDSYICMNGGELGIVSIDGRPQEYLVDYWLDSRCSVLNKMSCFDTFTHAIRKWAGREIGYLIVLPNEDIIVKLMKLGNYAICPNVFFTTRKRLQKKPWHEALFAVDQLGNCYSFTNASLSEKVFVSF